MDAPASLGPAVLFPIIAGMANEGIPVLAIARSVALPSESIYDALRSAIATGILVELPKDDWPPGQRKSQRCLSYGTPLATEEGLKTALSRHFRATPLEAAMFAMMMRRDEVTKPQLHSVIEACRDPNKETTEIKMVDVMICKLRKKLPAGVKIQTMWGSGYFISKEDRNLIFQLLLGV